MSQRNQRGGGACSICGSPGTNKSTCPLNPEAKHPNPAKHPMAATVPAAARAHGDMSTPRRRLSPARVVRDAAGKTDTRYMMVDTRAHGKTQRLSAGDYYRRYTYTVGDRCDIRNNGELRCLLKRSNGVPYWAAPSKSGKGQEACEDWSLKCQHEW